MAKIKEGRLKQLTPDDRNFNKHTDTGKAMLRKSIDRFGYGRSILVDKNDRIIGGNGVQEVSDDAKTIIVETTGDELVVVKRTDIDLDSKKGREMAMADNATGASDLLWDKDAIDKAVNDFGIELSDWGLELPDMSNIDDFFNDVENPSDSSKNIKISIELPSDYDDQKENIIAIIKTALKGYTGIKIR